MNDDDSGKGFKQDSIPLAAIHKIMKSQLPKKVTIDNEALCDVQRCTSEFISFITSEACEICLRERRKTMTGDDLILALESMGFDGYHETLKKYLVKMRESRRSGALAKDS